MKKQILILVSVILLALLLLSGCSNNKQNDTNIDTVKVGKYIGEPYNLTSSFIPILNLEKNNKFKFELGISKSVEGTYTINSNKLILNSSNGYEKYILEISNNALVIWHGIPNYVNDNSKFSLSENK